MNKNTLHFLFLFFIVNSVFSQNISFNELLKAKTYKFDKLEMFLAEKGFEYYKSFQDELSKAYHFSYKENGVIVAYFSEWTDHKPNGEKYISLQTSSEVFNRIKKQGISNGIKFIGKQDLYDKKGYFTIYEYSNYEISFYVSQGTVKGNVGKTVYEINVSLK